LTVTVLEAVAVQPLAFVTVTVYVVVEPGDTVILVVVAPVLHEYVPPPLAVKVAFCPLQIGDGLLMLAVGFVFTVKVLESVSVQPLAFVTVTEYVVVEEGETVMLAVVAPLLHEYVPPPLAVNVALCPTQMGAGLLIEAAGAEFTVTEREAVAVHPFASVTVTL